MPLLDRVRAFFRPRMVINLSVGDAPTQVLDYTAVRLYQTQDNLKAVVDFLASSIAQLPLEVYVRVGETERRRDRESVAAKLLWRPNPVQTCYELIDAVLHELFVFGCVYLWRVESAESSSGWELYVIPTTWILSSESLNAYALKSIRVRANGSVDGAVDIPADEFVRFAYYSPGNPGGYVSPIAGLRQVLQEQIEAGNFRKELWHSSGRLNAQLLRPANVMPWDETQRQKFIAAFREAWGSGGSKAGSIPLLEDGMEIKPFQTSFKEQQWAESVKLSRESVAAAYHVNPALIWHTDAQTYASSKDNARALYAECLGPVIQMLQQRINAFLLPAIGADPRTYVEFDLTEKLKGSFEERASIIQSAVGGPWMTRNEARADNNLPPIDGGDALITPLNVLTGGQASPQDTHMDEQEPMAIEDMDVDELGKWFEAVKKSCGCQECRMTDKPAVIKIKSRSSEEEDERKADKPTMIKIKSRSSKEEDERMADVLSAFFKRQKGSVLPKIGAGSDDWWQKGRWDKELADDIEPVIDSVADAHGKEVADALGSEYKTEQTRKYLRMLAEGRAAAINESTRKKLEAAMEEEEDDPETAQTPAHVFELREGKHSDVLGRSLALVAAGWATNREAPQQAEQQGVYKTVEKTWITGTNPRPEHAAMNGETVPVEAAFSNGCYWPGDENGDPDETCGCNCSTEITITVR